MKYIKKFKSKNLREGDYVVLKDDTKDLASEVRKYVLSHVGKYCKANNKTVTYELISWEDIDEDSGIPTHMIYNNTIQQYVLEKDIEYSSKNKEDCEAYIAAKKFNL